MQLIYHILLSFALCEICKRGNHTMYLLPQNEKGEGDVGLKAKRYYMFLQTDYLEDNNVYLMMNVSFPINVNIDLSSEIGYSFTPLHRFCLNDVLHGRMVNIVGKLKEFNTDYDILQSIWIKIENIIYNKNYKESGQLDQFLLMTRYIYGNNSKVIFMKSINRFKNTFFQLVRGDLTNENPSTCSQITNSDKIKDVEDVIFEIGTEASITNMNVQTDMIMENNIYRVLIKHKESIYELRLSNITNLVCREWDEFNYNKKCFEGAEKFIYDMVAEVEAINRENQKNAEKMAYIFGLNKKHKNLKG